MDRVLTDLENESGKPHQVVLSKFRHFNTFLEEYNKIYLMLSVSILIHFF
jgi:hypothetical protein